MSEPAVLYQESDGVACITLNRPERLNSLTPAMLDALRDRVEDVSRRPQVRVLVITGAGRAFCAGQDLAAMQGIEAGELLVRHYNPLVMALRGLEVPVVAAVNGVAAGAGLSLALACDLRVACATARFVTAFEKVGLVPDTGLSFFLPRMVGLGRAMQWLLLGRTLSAAEALEAGLVSDVAPDEEFPTRWKELASRLASGPRSLGYIRRLLAGSFDRALAEQLREEARLQQAAAATEDAREGMRAFLEKRPPRFQGR